MGLSLSVCACIAHLHGEKAVSTLFVLGAMGFAFNVVRLEFSNN